MSGKNKQIELNITNVFIYLTFSPQLQNIKNKHFFCYKTVVVVALKLFYFMCAIV